MSFNQEIRKKHSSMEYEKANSYSIMALSNEYKFAYQKYVPIIEAFIKVKGGVIRILNLGYASGVLENILLSNFENINFVSVDNSKTFSYICTNHNSLFIKKKRLILINLDLNNESINNDEFDIIFSRDLNHHIFSPEKYLLQCNILLKKDGIMIMEDLRYNAEFEGIHKFSELIFNIPEYKNDKWNFYHKMLGLYESFASAYLVDEIIQILESLHNYSYKYKVTDTRYHFVMFKNIALNNLVQDLLNLL